MAIFFSPHSTHDGFTPSVVSVSYGSTRLKQQQQLVQNIFIEDFFAELKPIFSIIKQEQK